MHTFCLSVGLLLSSMAVLYHVNGLLQRAYWIYFVVGRSPTTSNFIALYICLDLLKGSARIFLAQSHLRLFQYLTIFFLKIFSVEKTPKKVQYTKKKKKKEKEKRKTSTCFKGYLHFPPLPYRSPTNHFP